MVSGLEPHRGLMEAALRDWMSDTKKPCLVIAGQPGGGVQVDGHITTWCDPSDAELASALQEANTVVCRSGYSSQLDLAALGTRAILIPTPGQPEQEALGKLWASRFGFTCLTQKQLEAGNLPEHATGSLPDEPANLRALALLEQWLKTHQPAHT
jgi:UDP-N-acetylglucosamine:LPS N-acetylglucosamine transferase